MARKLLAGQGIAPEPYRSWGFSRRIEDGEIVFWYQQSRLPPVDRPVEIAYSPFDRRAPRSVQASVLLDPQGRLLRFDTPVELRAGEEPATDHPANETYGGTAFEFSSVAGRWTFSAWFVTVLVGTLFLSWRHFRDRSFDPTASSRLAGLVFVGRFAAGLLAARHVPGLAEIYVVQTHLAWALVVAGVAIQSFRIAAGQVPRSARRRA